MADRTPTVAAPSATDVKAVSALIAENESLAARRDAARERLETMTPPSRVEHLWRFTNPANLMPADVRPMVGTVRANPAEGNAAAVGLTPGATPVVSVSAAAAAAGLTVENLADVSGPLGDSAVDGSWFTTLNDASWSTGVVVRVPAGAVIDGPVHLIVEAGVGATAPRIVLEAGAASDVELVEEHRGGCDDTRVVGVTEIIAEPGARVRHVVVQTWNHGVHGHLGVHARAARDAEVSTAFCSLGGSRAKLDLISTLAGEGARSVMTGVALAADRQHLDHHTRHVHLTGRTSSDIDFKAVAAGRSRCSTTGLIRIEEDAREVEAFQENRNLLLSQEGRAESIPELEILNQDVSCSHGATVAPIDPTQIFYLQSRGIPASSARRLVVLGFLEKTLARMPETVRERVEAIVRERLDGLEEAGS